MSDLATVANTNRTTLSTIIQQQGYENYAAYLNHKRIKDFINLVASGKSDSYQQAFFDVGYRSHATAIRNFKQVSPSEYLDNTHNTSQNNCKDIPEE